MAAWQTIATMRTARAGKPFAARLPDGSIAALVAGTTGGTATLLCERYMPWGGAWAKIASAPSPLVANNHSAGLCTMPIAGNGDPLVLYTHLNGTQIAAARLDSEALTWTDAPLNIDPYQYEILELASGLVSMVFQGRQFNPATNTWASGIATPSLSHVDGRPIRLSNGLIWIAGGSATQCELSTTAAAVAWTQTSAGSLPAARTFFEVTLLPNGKVLVSGGLIGGSATASCVLYDPSTGLVTNTGSLNHARTYHSTVLLADGSVLAVGGASDANGNALTSAERYVPSTGLWTDVESMTTKRAIMSLILSLDGATVYAVGGYDYNGGSALYRKSMESWAAPLPAVIAPPALPPTITARGTDTNYGTDIDVESDLPLRFNLVSGPRNVAKALVRRFTTQHGAFAVIDGDEEYGFDLRNLLNETVAPGDSGLWKSTITDQALFDDRISSCLVDISISGSSQSQSATVTITPTLITGEIFDLVLLVTALTVTVLETP